MLFLKFIKVAAAVSGVIVISWSFFTVAIVHINQVKSERDEIQANLKLQNKIDSLFNYSVVGGYPPLSKSSAKGQMPNKPSSMMQFSIEIDTVDTKKQAEDLLDSLKKEGILAFFTPVRNGDSVRYQIRKGLYYRLDSAQDAQRNLAKHLKRKPKLVRIY